MVATGLQPLGRRKERSIMSTFCRRRLEQGAGLPGNYLRDQSTAE